MTVRPPGGGGFPPWLGGRLLAGGVYARGAAADGGTDGAAGGCVDAGIFPGFRQGGKAPKAPGETIALSGIIGTAIGLYDGLIGPGTGTFLTIAFSAVLGFSLLKSSGCAKIANLASNVASMVVFFCHGDILFSVGIPAMACSMLGNYMGSRYAIQGGSTKIRRVMFLMLGLLFVKVGLNVLGIIDF